MTDPVVSSYPGYARRDPVGDLVAWLTQVWDADVKRITHPTFCAPVWPTADEMLARIAADRQILALHKPYQRIIGLGCEVCLGSANEGRDAAFPGFPCPTVRLLAQPYAEREGFQDEWKVWA